MRNIENLLKILNATESYISTLGVTNKDLSDLRKLIIALENKKDVNIEKIILAIESLDSKTKSTKNKSDLKELKEVYKKIFLDNHISDKELKIRRAYNKDDVVVKLLKCKESELLSFLNNEKTNNQPVDVLKIIAYCRFGIQFKGKKSRMAVVNEIKSFISQKNYYKNMENAYNN